MLPLHSDPGAAKRIAGYLRDEACHYSGEGYNALRRIASEIEERSTLPGEENVIEKAPKVVSRLFMVEHDQSAYIWVETKVDDVSIPGSHCVVSITTFCRPEDKGYETHRQRVAAMRRFLKGEITLKVLREELF